MSAFDYDVVVVGGGPAGAAAAKAAVEGGLNTLIVERQKMPRHKACDGQVLPAAFPHIERHFGPIPDDVKAEPFALKGTRWHLRGGKVFEFAYGSQRFGQVWRDRFDHWLCGESGAEVWDSTALVDFAEWKDRVDLVCRRKDEKDIRLSARALVAADGGTSGTVKRIDPTYDRGLILTYTQQDYLRGEVDLDPDYYHVFLEPGIGLMPVLYFKDGLMVTDSIIHTGEKVKPVSERFHRWLADNHRFRPAEQVFTLGCLMTGGSSINRFCFGTDRVLVAGEAAGFVNMYFEGISSAIATGYLAGRAVVPCADHPPGPVYREAVKPERVRTIEEWYPPALMTGKAAPTLRECFTTGPPALRLKFASDFLAWFRRMGFESRWSVELMARKFLNRGFDYRA